MAGTSWLSDLISLLVSSWALGAVGLAVGGDYALVDPAGRLELDVMIAGEQVVESSDLLVRKDVGAGLQAPPSGVEWVVLVATVPVASEASFRRSVRHVEVFQLGSVRTSILGRPRRLSGHRRADGV